MASLSFLGTLPGPNYSHRAKLCVKNSVTTPDEVKLLGTWRSPYSKRVELALKLKGVQYNYVEEDLLNKSPLLVELNPAYKKIPVLVHNGKPMAESLVILEYIDETWNGHQILPEDSYQRARARFWAKFIDDKCIPGIWQAVRSKGEERDKVIEEVCLNLKMLEKELEGKKFFGGDKIGLVDIAANFIAFWLGVLQEGTGVEFVTKENFPILCNWADNFAITFNESLPHRDKIVAFVKAFVH